MKWLAVLLLATAVSSAPHNPDGKPWPSFNVTITIFWDIETLFEEHLC